MKLLVDDRFKDLHESREYGGDVLLHQHNELFPPLRGDEVRARTGKLFRGRLEKHQTKGDSLGGTDKLQRERGRGREGERAGGETKVISVIKTTSVDQRRSR